jgi:Na+-transporting methylmalonyl-CoA/oxaloacetate decarboxylase gamma subunit
MSDWDLAAKILFFGLSAVFGSLAVLIGAIYAFGKILKSTEKQSNEKG